MKVPNVPPRLEVAPEISLDGYLEKPADLPTTWTPVDLALILVGNDSEDEPTILTRTDGICLMYRGRIHSLYAEPEGLKTWLALEGCRQELMAGHHVTYIDFEDNARGIVRRLQAMGVPDDVIRFRFHYVRPFERLTEKAWGEVAATFEHDPTLAVLDGVTEGMVLEGLNLLDNTDAATYLERLPRRVGRLGPAVLQLDHVGRNTEARGRFAIGAQAKLAGIDGAAYSIDLKEPFGRNRTGRGRLLLRKDRQGYVSEYAQGDKRDIAQIVATSWDGDVTIDLEPPIDPSNWKPTRLMEKVSDALEAMPGLTTNGIVDHVGGRREYVLQAVAALVAAGHVRTESGPRNSTEHHLEHPYKEGENT